MSQENVEVVKRATAAYLAHDNEAARALYDPDIETRQRAVAVARGFDLKEHSLALYARCTKPDCGHRQK